MKSDEYPDREKLGKAIIFNINCNPYKGIDQSFKISKEMYKEYYAWRCSSRVIEKAIGSAKEHEQIDALLKFHLKSRRV